MLCARGRRSVVEPNRADELVVFSEAQLQSLIFMGLSSHVQHSDAKLYHVQAILQSIVFLELFESFYKTTVGGHMKIAIRLFLWLLHLSSCNVFFSRFRGKDNPRCIAVAPGV